MADGQMFEVSFGHIILDILIKVEIVFPLLVGYQREFSAHPDTVIRYLT